jgi:MoxR-like ATPase
MNIFKQLGIYGFEEEKEDAVLASLLTGDPVLLIGKQGTAKTALATSIGSALREKSKKDSPDEPKKWFNYHAYDSSKINFEDLLGMPSPSALKEGKIDFVKSPMTIWDKHLVVFDEFNRQLPERQNNIFEIIRSRSIMGLPTGTKWIINCMNPFGMAGTEILDDALVDRHQWFIYVNDFEKLSERDKDTVVQHIGHHDAVALKIWTKTKGDFDVSEVKGTYNKNLAKAGTSIVHLLNNAAVHYKTLSDDVGKDWASFISRYFSTLISDMQNKDWQIELSGRRAGMIWRALMAYRAIDLAKCEQDPQRSLKDLKEMFKAVMRMTIPVGVATAEASGINSDALNSINSNVDLYSEFFTSKNSRAAIDVIYELLTTKSIQRKIELLVNQVDDEVARNHIWTSILSEESANKHEQMRNGIIVGIIGHLMTVKPETVPVNMQHLVAQKSYDVHGMTSLYDSITLGGHIAFYADEMQEHLDQYENIFIKLQAKILFQDFVLKHSGQKVKRSDFYRVVEQVKAECNSLESMLNEQTFISREDPSTTV